MSISSNPLYANQWHFDLIGDIETIWSEYSGAGVTVAVFDDGTEQYHSDLDDNYDSSLSYDGIGSDNNGQPYYSGYHGTAVAGIIGAENNSEGGVGVAWGVSLVGVNLLDALQDSLYSPYLALREIEDYDIVNASWGYTTDFSYSLAGSYSYARREFDTTVSAIDSGRDGLGSLMFKAAGNDNNNYYDAALGNAQGDYFNNIHSVVTVAATYSSGWVTDYSNWGANLLVSAPAAAVTTDITGGNGYSYSDHTTTFGGTSAATPVVSGVAALLLEANDGLGWRDVHNILAISAAQTGSAYGASAGGYEESAWFSNGATNWNGGGMTFNLSYGFGMVDAFAAVRMAEVWTTLYGTAQTSSNDVVVDESYSGSSISVGDFGATDMVVTVSDDIMIEQVYVTLDYYHSDLSDVTVDLIAPDGTSFRLFDQDAPNGTFYSDEYTFSVRGLVGVSSQGDWTVRINDTGFGSTGTLRDVDLEFRGAEASADTVHHLTQDFFSSLARAETSRQTLTDMDGGTDWLNLVALQGDVDLVLQDGAILSVSGETVTATLSNGSDFENVALGDGNDQVNGNASANHLMGGRGNDALGGQGGNDIIAGGSGDDILTGDGVGVSSIADAQAVFRLYQATLDRAPDAGGLLTWVTALETQSLTDIVAGFTNSREFQNNYDVSANVDFVTLLYNNVLDRNPDDGGLANWVGLLDSGTMNRSQVVLGFSESREFRNDTVQASLDYTIGDAAQAWTDDVFRLYQATLDRAPDIDGLLSWMGNLASGMGYLDVVGGFIGSVEFNSTYGSTDDTQFVTLLYNNVLNRNPDAGGLASWVDLLDSGAMGRDGVVRGFAQSPEFTTNSTDDLITYMRDQDIDDQLSGGSGNNTLYGGAGRDSFAFFDADAASTHLIADFESWDVLDLTGLGFSSVSSLTFTDTASDVEIALGNGGTLTIEDWQSTDFTSDHFIF